LDFHLLTEQHRRRTIPAAELRSAPGMTILLFMFTASINLRHR
jgi:hypothetical protein